MFVLTWLAIYAPGPVAKAQSAASVTVTVDATSVGAPLKRIWAYHGYDELNYATLPDGQSLLKTLGLIHTTTPHIRSHFYLNSGNGVPAMKWGSTNVYSLDPSGTAVFNWTLIDAVTDGLIGAGTLPFVEIGFMPHDLSVHPDPYTNSSVLALDGGCFYPPKDYVKWESLISEWGRHSAARYPNAEAAWQWELWNEPDLAYWHGTPAEYDKLFDYTEAGLHQVLPNASLGGPASYNPQSGFMRQFLQHCATGVNAVSGKAGARLDMVTFHAKGGTAVVANHVQMNMGNQLGLHRTGFGTVASFTQFKQTPIVVSEGDPDGCAACQTPPDAYRPLPAYGAYEVEMMKRSLDLEAQLGVNLQGIVAWAFMFPGQPFFANYRVLSTNGIALPVLNAFKLMGSLDGVRLPVTSSGALALDGIISNGVRAQPDIDAMAALKGQLIQVLVWNYHDDIVASAASSVHVIVRVPATFGMHASIDHLRMDDTHGNAYAAWISQGSPGAPSVAQVTQLQQAASALTLQPTQAADVVGGAIAVDFELPRFGVSLLRIGPAGGGGQADASTDSSVAPQGLDAGALADALAVTPADVGTALATDGSTVSGGVADGGASASSQNDAAVLPSLDDGGNVAGSSDGGPSSLAARPPGASGCSCDALGSDAASRRTDLAATCLLPLLMALRLRKHGKPGRLRTDALQPK